MKSLLRQVASYSVVNFVLLCFAATQNAALEPASTTLNKRETFYGGWALVAPPEGCPSDLNECDAFTGLSCCPDGTECITNSGSSAVCCPTENDCRDVVEELPICADPSWNLWSTTNYPICCQKGEQGLNPGEEADYIGSCIAADISVPKEKQATLDTSGTGSPATSGSGSTDVPAAETGSSSSSSPSVSSSPSSSNDPTISTAAIGGIAAGCAVFLLIIAGLGFWYLRRIRKQYAKQLEAHGQMMQQNYGAGVGGGFGGAGELEARKAPAATATSMGHFAPAEKNLQHPLPAEVEAQRRNEIARYELGEGR